MSKLSNIAAKELKKLSKRKQKELNKAKRIPVAPPGHEFSKDTVRKKKWEEDD